LGPSGLKGQVNSALGNAQGFSEAKKTAGLKSVKTQKSIPAEMNDEVFYDVYSKPDIQFNYCLSNPEKVTRSYL